MRRIFAPLVLTTLLSALASPVAAEDTPSGELAVQDDADVGTHPDEGLMIAGATVFLTSVLAGVAILMPIQLGHCYDPGSARAAGLPPDSGYASCGQAPYAAIPFAHLVGGGIDSIIGGPILLIAEIVGLFTFIGGAAHHRANEPIVTLTGVPSADVGLGIALSL